MTSELSRHIPALNPEHLRQYTDEPAHLIGHIQPHGALLVLQRCNLQVVQVSRNVAQFLGFTPEQLLGKPLHRIFHDSTDAMTAAIQAESTEPLLLSARAHPKQLYLVTPFYGEGWVALELEVSDLSSAHLLSLHHGLSEATSQIQQATSTSGLGQIITQAIKRITGFDRVMVYRFADDGSGVVIAEAVEADLDPFLGLHYPAVDVPPTARRIFTQKSLRAIPDAAYEPVPLVSQAPQAVDLTLSNLRGVSECHRTYLKNMGVRASLTIPIAQHQQLWGLVACHHRSPKRVSHEVHQICQVLGKLASAQVYLQQAWELRQYRQRMRHIDHGFRQALNDNPGDMARVLNLNHSTLLSFVRADGLAIILGDTILLRGQTPHEEDVRQLSDWMKGQGTQEVYVTDSLLAQYPAAQRFTSPVAGVLSLTVSVGQQVAYQINWFRGEQSYSVHWGGNPDDAVEADADGFRLRPRGSFATWQQQVQGRSLPWQPVELEAASELRHTLLLAALENTKADLEVAASEARQANRSKDEFLANMSHEIRTPMNAILGFTQLLEATQLTIQQQKYIASISASGEDLLVIIHDILDLAKLEAGTLALNPMAFNVLHVLHELVQRFRPITEEKALALELQVADDVPTCLYGPVERLRQILANLINNAIKFTNAGTIAVSVIADEPLNAEAQGPVNLTFRVRDTGIGIAPEDQERVFEPFTQLDGSLTRQHEGTGLGLAICQKIIDLMQGQIGVVSMPGQGSTFWFQLPFSPAHGTLDPAPPKGQQHTNGATGTTLLVVEDVPLNQKLMRKVLASLGYTADIAGDGIQALEKMAQRSYPLVLMDCQMPRLDGYETTRRLRQTQGPCQQSVVIGLTAHAMVGDRAKCLAAGMDDYTSKPVQLARLDELIHHWLAVE